MSFSLARASAHTVLSLTAAATARTPRSRRGSRRGSRPRSRPRACARAAARCAASRRAVIDAPGLCSPSRMVVSNMINWSCMVVSREMPDGLRRPAVAGRPRCCARLQGWEFLAREAQQQAERERAGAGRGGKSEMRLQRFMATTIATAAPGWQLRAGSARARARLAAVAQ